MYALLVHISTDKIVSLILPAPMAEFGIVNWFNASVLKILFGMAKLV